MHENFQRLMGGFMMTKQLHRYQSYVALQPQDPATSPNNLFDGLFSRLVLRILRDCSVEFWDV